jgi:glutathione S-transferase
MYELYIANKNYSSWSLRPWLLMRMLGIGFSEKLIPFIEGSNYEHFRHFSPTGRVPCLVDGGFTVWDSLAIGEYLAERHDGVWPAQPRARAWARCAAAEMHSGFAAVRNQCSMNCGVRVRLHRIDAALRAEVARLCELWRQGLERHGGPFLGGADFTAVDAFFAPMAFRAQSYALPLDEPAQQYANRLLDLPAMREWYDAGVRETWRESLHEAEVVQAGEVWADYRSVAGA